MLEARMFANSVVSESKELTDSLFALPESLKRGQPEFAFISGFQ